MRSVTYDSGTRLLPLNHSLPRLTFNLISTHNATLGIRNSYIRRTIRKPMNDSLLRLKFSLISTHSTTAGSQNSLLYDPLKCSLICFSSTLLPIHYTALEEKLLLPLRIKGSLERLFSPRLSHNKLFYHGYYDETTSSTMVTTMRSRR